MKVTTKMDGIKMKVYKVSYKLFGCLPCLDSETSQANVRADNANDAIEKLKKAVQEVVESYVRDNKSDITFHCFLPKEDVIKKGWSTEVYDELLEPYFGNLVCMNYVNKPINVNREDLFKTLKAMNGVAFFVGAIVDGVQDEFEMAKRHSIHCYTVPLI